MSFSSGSSPSPYKSFSVTGSPTGSSKSTKKSATSGFSNFLAPSASGASNSNGVLNSPSSAAIGSSVGSTTVEISISAGGTSHSEPSHSADVSSAADSTGIVATSSPLSSVMLTSLPSM